MKDINYYKKRACCDPANEWGHTDDCKVYIQLSILKQLIRFVDNIMNINCNDTYESAMIRKTREIIKKIETTD